MPRSFRQITPHIHRLELRWWGFSVCVWMVRDGEEWSLIDAGPPATAPTIFAALERLRAVPTRILLSHGHPDHVGALGEIVARFAIPFWCHRLEASFLAGSARYGQIKPSTSTYRALSRLIPTPNFPDLRPQLLEENECLGGLRAVPVPGHAPGHLAFLHEADRALLSADVFRFKPGSALPLWTPDPMEARASMRKLAALDFDHLLPSHGPPILGNGKARAQNAA